MRRVKQTPVGERLHIHVLPLGPEIVVGGKSDRASCQCFFFVPLRLGLQCTPSRACLRGRRPPKISPLTTTFASEGLCRLTIPSYPGISREGGGFGGEGMRTGEFPCHREASEINHACYRNGRQRSIYIPSGNRSSGVMRRPV